MLNPYGSSGFRVTSIQGTRVLGGIAGFHNGIDLVGTGGKNIYAVCGGTVVQSRIVTDTSNKTWEWGNYIAIRDDSGTSSDGFIIYHCHLSQRLVEYGQKVVRGTLIGTEGSTGYSTGSHLHLEVRSGTQIMSAADYIGIPNAVADYPAVTPDYRASVVRKTGISEITADYIGAYAYADDLWRKLWTAME